MLFEYDPAKRDENKRKYGIDFEEAQVLWDDPALLEIPARDWSRIGKITLDDLGEKLWSAFITRRGAKLCG